MVFGRLSFDAQFNALHTFMGSLTPFYFHTVCACVGVRVRLLSAVLVVLVVVVRPFASSVVC